MVVQPDASPFNPSGMLVARNQPTSNPRRTRHHRRGAAMIEYCLILSLLAMGGIAGTQRLSAWVSKTFAKAGAGVRGGNAVSVESSQVETDAMR